MTDEHFLQVQPVIVLSQRLHGSLHRKLIDGQGVRPIDALVAAIYSTHDLASRVHGNPVAAVEWIRDAADTIERQLMERLN